MNILAIDPGNIQSAFVVWDGKNILFKTKLDNCDIFPLIYDLKDSIGIDKIIIEMVASYGMAVGETVFETVFWIGRFYQEAIELDIPVDRMKRLEVKLHICHQTRAKDANIIQALIDRFAPNTPNKGKGYKKDPGFFYGFKADIWQAFALAVTYYDTLTN